MTQYLYDADNRATVVVDALGNRTTTLLDAVGNTTGVLDGRGNLTQFQYDADNRVTVAVTSRYQFFIPFLFDNQTVTLESSSTMTIVH